MGEEGSMNCWLLISAWKSYSKEYYPVERLEGTGLFTGLPICFVNLVVACVVYNAYNVSSPHPHDD